IINIDPIVLDEITTAVIAELEALLCDHYAYDGHRPDNVQYSSGVVYYSSSSSSSSSSTVYVSVFPTCSVLPFCSVRVSYQVSDVRWHEVRVRVRVLVLELLSVS
ncbi:hypothetical protein Vretimale_11325, partial [Volvox reticuliferus]